MPADALRNADKIFLATAIGGIIPASRTDGRAMDNDRLGPLSERLSNHKLGASRHRLVLDAR